MHFNSKTVSKITGLSMRQIDYWDRTHFIKPSVSEASGYGSLRLYSFTDLVQLRVARTLLGKGVSLQKMRKAMIYLKKNIPAVKKPFLELKFLTDGETIFIITKNEKKIIDILKSGQLVFSIALGKIVEDLKGDIISLQKEKKYKITVKGKQYPVILHRNTSGRGYRTECPSLPGHLSQGDTVEEALGRTKDAIEEGLPLDNRVNLISKRR